MARKLNQIGGFSLGQQGARRFRPKKPAKPKVTYQQSRPTYQAVTPPPVAGTTDWLGQFTQGYGSAPAGVGQKQRRQYYQSPVYQGSGTTNRQLDQLVKSATQTQFGPQQTQLNQQYGQSAAMEQKIPEWFAGYQALLKDLSAQDAAASQQAVGQISGLGGTLANAAAQAASQDQQAMQADAAIRGATIDPAAITRATQAAALNTQALSDQAALQTQLGFNTGANWRTQQQAGGQAQIQALMDELGYRRGTLDPQALQLTRDIGAFANTYRNDQRNTLIDQAQNQRAIDWAMQDDQIDNAQNAENAVLSAQNQAANRNATNRRAANSIRAQNRRARQTARQQAQTVNKYGYTNAQWAAMTPAQRRKVMVELNTQLHPKTPKEKPDRGLTPTQEREAWGQVSQMVDFFRNPPKNADTGKPLTSAELINEFRSGKSPVGRVTPELVNVARSIASNNGAGIGPWGVGQAHKAGLTVGKRYRVLPGPKKSKNPLDNIGTIRGTYQTGG